MNIATGGQTGASELLIAFDFFDENSSPDDNVLSEQLTQDEKKEIYRVVGDFEGANIAELVDFMSQEFAIVNPVNTRQ